MPNNDVWNPQVHGQPQPQQPQQPQYSSEQYEQGHQESPPERTYQAPPQPQQPQNSSAQYEQKYRESPPQRQPYQAGQPYQGQPYMPQQQGYQTYSQPVQTDQVMKLSEFFKIWAIGLLNCVPVFGFIAWLIIMINMLKNPNETESRKNCIKFFLILNCVSVGVAILFWLICMATLIPIMQTVLAAG